MSFGRRATEKEHGSQGVIDSSLNYFCFNNPIVHNQSETIPFLFETGRR
jgi:hypothetical protein